MEDSRMAAREDLPGRPASVWLATTPETDYDPLDGDLRVETAVVGGGIAGITTALALAEAGRDVVLLERDRVGVGVTGHTTAKVTTQHGLVYADLVRKHGPETARRYAAANRAGVEFVAERVAEHGIDCALRRLPAYTYVEEADRADEVREEVRAASAVGLPAAEVDSVPVGDAAAGVRFDDQASFDPRRYLLALAEAFVDAGGRICEETRVADVDGGRPARVETDRGDVRARDVVLATHFPILDRAGYFARQYPKRSYVLAVRAGDPPREGMYYAPGEPYFSARTAEVDGEELTLVGGQNHKTGQGGSTAERYRRLDRLARERFDVETVEYRWATQDFVSVDGVPYVGHLGPFATNVYVATGFGGWGMSNGTAAGMMLSDAILGEEGTQRSAVTDPDDPAGGRPADWLRAFDPLRKTVRASTKTAASENANVARRFVGDWARGLRGRKLRNLGRDEATVCRRGDDVLGVYRDEAGDLHAVDAVCPHLGCLVQWNDGERTWDCPCHGSRFDLDGRVLNGPANEDLDLEDL